MGALKIKVKPVKYKGFIIIAPGDKRPKRPHIVVNDEGKIVGNGGRGRNR